MEGGQGRGRAAAPPRVRAVQRRDERNTEKEIEPVAKGEDKGAKRRDEMLLLFSVLRNNSVHLHTK